MKKNRKLTALLVAACMTIPMAATTFTVPMMASGADTGSIQIDTNENFGTAYYYAYQIFTVNENVITENSQTTYNYSVTGWGDGIDVAGLIEDLKADTTIGVLFNDVGDADENSAKQASDVADIVAGFDSERAQIFARIAGANIKKNASVTDANDKHKNTYGEFASGTSKSNHQSYNPASSTISELPYGYYVVIEAYAPDGLNDYDAYANTARTLGVLRVVGSNPVTNIEVKRSFPKVEKKVEEGYGTNNYKDYADYNIGDTINFQIEATLPDHLDYYEEYYFEINDTLGKAFTLNQETIKIYIDGTEITTTDIDECNLVVSGGGELDTNISVTFENIKFFDKAQNDKVVKLTYSATLNDKAVAGNNAFSNSSTSQENQVSVTYLANPNIDWKPSDNSKLDTPEDILGTNEETNLATTPIDKVRVFTYQLDIDKYDGNTNDRLADAKFKLKVKDGKYAVLTGSNGNYTVTGWDADEAKGSEFATITGGKVSILGLDAGTYELIETAAPGGYNPLNENKEFTITADLTGENLTLKELKIDETGGAVDTGIVILGVANNKGTTLPETGGIGTKIFYILGGTLVIGSGAALVIKKRMGKDEE